MTDPWKDLAIPEAAARISARRVDDTLRWNFFWAKDTDRKCLLVLRHQPASSPSRRLPTLNGIEVLDTDSEESGAKVLVLRLADSSQRDLFQQLCLDIISATRPAESEGEAVELALARTWRWHHLLRGGSSGLLGPEEQKGLLGELLFLESYLLRLFPADDAVAAWHGPFDAPKDFEIGRVCVEAKARRGAATPFVAISSEHQLDSAGLDGLFLHVVNLSGAPSGDESALTLTDVAGRLRDWIAAQDQSAVEEYEIRLFASGFGWQQDYTGSRWIVGPAQTYRVGEGFPRITSVGAPSGVSNVRYSIGLRECAPFALNDGDLDAAITGAAHGN